MLAAMARRLARPLGLLLVLLVARTALPGFSSGLDRTLGEGAAALLDRTLWAATWLATAFLLVRALDVCVWQRRTPHLPRLLTDLVAALVWIAAGLVVVGRLTEMPLAGILTTSGVAVAVLGFALRDMLASLFAGLALNLERPYRIGDWLEITPGTVGQVVEVGWLTTRLLTQDGVGLVVPNAQLATRGFSNFDHEGGVWRDQVTVTLAYDVSPARAERILLAAAATVPAAHRTGRQPDARIVALGESGVTWTLRYWLQSYAERTEARHEVQAAILRHLYRAGLEPAHRRLDLFHTRLRPPAFEHRGRLDVLLARSDLFGLLDETDLRLLAAAARRRHVPAGEAVVRQGEPGSSLFVVVEGVLDVTIDRGQGPSRWVRLLAAGDMFGEYSLLTGEPRSATVCARTESLLFEITKADLLPVLERSPELARAMSRILTARQADRSSEVPSTPPPSPGGEHGLLQRIRAFFGLPGERA
ncbi:mechanosensitive ion channel family protein [Benzoatithermus flavus]|uniref:Small-conductance mechanosensitive channel n=1 Tax=Benzoatithermus flavus TaxID=3108223 RepID=A0ABU8XSR0_9PROT